jgi:hypothetical protein
MFLIASPRPPPEPDRLQSGHPRLGSPIHWDAGSRRDRSDRRAAPSHGSLGHRAERPGQGRGPSKTNPANTALMAITLVTAVMAWSRR